MRKAKAKQKRKGYEFTKTPDILETNYETKSQSQSTDNVPS